MITLRQTATDNSFFLFYTQIIADDYFASNRNYLNVVDVAVIIIADDYFASNRNYAHSNWYIFRIIADDYFASNRNWS